MTSTYTAVQYDYICEVFCFWCKKEFHVYLSWDEYQTYISSTKSYKKLNPYHYNCPFCDKIGCTTSIKCIGRKLQDGSVSLEELHNALDSWIESIKAGDLSGAF